MPAPVVAAAARAATSEVASSAVSAAARRAVLRRGFQQGMREAGRGGPSFFSRARGSIWEIQGWDALFEKYLPRITHTITVRAIGAKDTPLDTVVHMALATLFGCVRFEPMFASSAIKAEVSHSQNSVSIQYAYSTIAAAEVAGAVDRFLKRVFQDPATRRLVSRQAAALPFGPRVGRVVAPALEEGMRQIGEHLPDGAAGGIVGGGAGIGMDIGGGAAGGIVGGGQRWGAGPNVTNTTSAASGSPPQINPNDVLRNKAAEEAAAKKKARERQRARMNLLGSIFGLDALYSLGRTSIRASPPSTMLDTADPKDRPQPLRNMIGKVILTRLPAANPQPPSAFGNDLRTLVAQVLHDPGVRPPQPLTAYGPPTADPRAA